MSCMSSLQRGKARHGEIIGPGPNSLARRVITRQSEVHQPEEPNSPWMLAQNTLWRVHPEPALFHEKSYFYKFNTYNQGRSPLWAEQGHGPPQIF
ncbi:hypothetical protein QL285_045178 [Trifolium repens]|nr:hypothetical protein QL285_045178 [Trifolium repens]